MAAASRMHAVEQGDDLRGVTVLAFGGAGPVHACGVAELLESHRVVFPANASVLSAFGTLVTPVRIDLARSMVRPLATVDIAERDALLDELRAEGRRVLAAAGVRTGGRSASATASTPATWARATRSRSGSARGDDDWPATDAQVVEHFEADYRRIYGLTIPDVGVEAVTWRLSAFAAAATVEPTTVVNTTDGEPMRHRLVRFDRGTAPRSTRRCTAAATSASASASTAPRSSKNARPPRSSARTGPSSVLPTAR